MREDGCKCKGGKRRFLTTQMLRHWCTHAVIYGISCDDETFINAVGMHESLPEEPFSDELRILLIADLTIDTEGREVPVECRLQDFRKRYGISSDTFRNSCRIAYMLGMTAEDYSQCPQNLFLKKTSE